MWFLFALSLACMQDSDCIIRPQNCCSCNQGGKQEAVHKKTPQKNCSDHMCAQVLSQDKSCKLTQAVCKDKQCTLK